jgi:hypothetical protein
MAVEVGRACLEKCKSMGYEGAIYYGMVKEYADTRGWGVWEVFRELVQNALDEMQEVTGRRPTYYPCKHVPDIRGVVIYDTGRGIATYNLYIGKSEKKPWQRGKFGEGLKIALMTAAANKIPVVVRSGDKEFVPTFARELVEGVPLDVFCICVRKLPTPITGTEVYMYKQGNLCYKFWNRVVQGIMERKPKAILVSLWHFSETEPSDTWWYDLIDKSATGGEPFIYVRDIYVSNLREATGHDACFSYNLYDVELDESRRIASTLSVAYDIGRLWIRLLDRFEPEKARVDETQKKIKKLLKDFLRCVLKDCTEQRLFESTNFVMPSWWVTPFPERVQKLRLLLDEIVGKDAVITKDRELAEFLEYLDIPHVYCPSLFGAEAEKWFNIEAIIRAKLEVKKEMIVPRDRIEPELREKLEILEEIAKILFEPPEYVKVEYMIDVTKYKGRALDNLILMDLITLRKKCKSDAYDCMEFFLRTYGHELAHVLTKKGDLTEEHTKALTDLMGKATTNAIKYVDRIKPLVDRFFKMFRSPPS